MKSQALGEKALGLPQYGNGKKNGRSHLSLGMLWLTVKSLISCSSFTSEFKAAGSTLDCIVGL